MSPTIATFFRILEKNHQIVGTQVVETILTDVYAISTRIRIAVWLLSADHSYHTYNIHSQIGSYEMHTVTHERKACITRDKETMDLNPPDVVASFHQSIHCEENHVYLFLDISFHL